MKKKTIIIISMVIFILTLVAINIFLGSRGNIKTELGNNQEEIERKEGIMEVTSQNFEEIVLKSEKAVIIDFYATWCNPCKRLFPIIEEIAKENKDVKFVKIDIDKIEDIKNQYQIKAIPTLVLIQDGKEKDRIVEIVDKAKILEFIEGKE